MGFDNGVCFSTGYRANRRSISSSDNILNTDFYIGCNQIAEITLLLPTNPRDGQMFIVKDESGSASSLNIIIDANGGTIDGESSFTINVDYGAVNIMSNDTEYYIF